MKIFIFYTYLLLSILLTQVSCKSTNGRPNYSNYKSSRQDFFKKRYSKNFIKADDQCDRLRKKKLRQKNRSVKVASRKKKKKKQVYLAEVDPNDTPTAKPAPKPKPKPQPKVEPENKTPDIETMSIDEKHKIEDEVLIKNKLPAPTSEKHEQIRKEVEKHLENFDQEKPLKLEPLYFITGQDEFAFVDMEPFLIAVEYALQGKHILIEGHTDHVGDFKANVALSIKRVEKIRELMVQMGVHDDHISVVGYGEEHSSEAKAAEKKQEERRVDFTVF
ncbi:MAG: OmpA family protein [Fulvivirga sp.]|uniref:OmpA family protein n=1 Tax=Fulvivirga sp. TaxID=1931237 RepID=UPI0032EF8168